MLQGSEPSRSSSSAAAPSDVLQIAASVRGIHSDIHSHPQVISAEKALQLTAQLICRKSRCFTNPDKFFAFRAGSCVITFCWSPLLSSHLRYSPNAVTPHPTKSTSQYVRLISASLLIQNPKAQTQQLSGISPVRRPSTASAYRLEPLLLQHTDQKRSRPSSSAAIWRFASCRVAALARSRNASHVHSPRR